MFYQLRVSFVIITIFVTTNHYNVVDASPKTGKTIEDFCKDVEFKNCFNSGIKEMCPNRCAIAVALHTASENYQKISSSPKNISEKEDMQTEGVYANVSEPRPSDKEWCNLTVNLQDCQKPKVKKACPIKCGGYQNASESHPVDKEWCNLTVNLQDCQKPKVKKACPIKCGGYPNTTKSHLIDEEWCSHAVNMDDCQKPKVKSACPIKCNPNSSVDQEWCKYAVNLDDCVKPNVKTACPIKCNPNTSVDQEWCKYAVNLDDCVKPNVKTACPIKCKPNKYIDKEWCQYVVDNFKDCEKPQTHSACPAICKSKGFKMDEPWCRLAVQMVECKHKQIIERCPNFCSNSLSESCGEIRVTDRIVGGQDTELNEYPWVVGFYFRYSFLCGGTLLNEKWVLTASHCFRRGTVNDFLITIGEHDLRTDDEADNILRNISRVIMHKYFDKPIPYANDIAVVLLAKPVELSAIASPICLATIDKNYDDVDAIVTGWGAIKYGDSGANILKGTIVHTMPTWKCRKSRSRNWLYRVIRKDWICADILGGGEDACQGDSGGPLMLIEDGRYVQIGIVSWGNGCGMMGNPGVYTRVTEYIDWIKRNTNEESQCKEDSRAVCYNRLPSDVRQAYPSSKKFNEI